MRAFPNVTFIWKHDSTVSNMTSSDNIVTTKWFPQNDLLSKQAFYYDVIIIQSL